MRASHIIGLISFALLLSAGQILFKQVALSVPKLTGGSGIVAMFQAPLFWLALLLYGIATALWIYMLQLVPLSRAYPFATIGFVLVPAAGILLFHERVSPLYLVGSALVIGGILLIGLAD